MIAIGVTGLRCFFEALSPQVSADSVRFGCEQDRYYHVGTARASIQAERHWATWKKQRISRIQMLLIEFHTKKMFSKNIQLCKKIISLCITYTTKKRYIYISLYIYIYHVSHLTDLWNCPKVERYISSSVISLLRHASADNMFEPQSAKDWKLKNLIWLYCPNDLTISSIYLISKYI